MSPEIPEPDDGQHYYYTKAKGKGMKPNYWSGFVLANSPDSVEEIVRDGYPSNLSLGIQGIRYVKTSGAITEDEIEDRLRSAFHPNSVVFRDGDGEVGQVRRGELPA